MPILQLISSIISWIQIQLSFEFPQSIQRKAFFYQTRMSSHNQNSMESRNPKSFQVRIKLPDFSITKISLHPSVHPLVLFLFPLNILNTGFQRKGNSSCSSYKLADCILDKICFQPQNCKCNINSQQPENIPHLLSKRLSTSPGLNGNAESYLLSNKGERKRAQFK